jgi:sugar lactone lactonase YvrE
MATGRVLAWRPGAGWTELPGGETVFPNGLALSPDGATLFVNSSLDGAVYRLDLATGRRTGRASIPGPDNSTWSPDGLLLVASFTGRLFDTLACDGLERGACPVPFQIVALDPRTLATQVVFASSGAPMGGGTVAVRVGDELFVGSFAGDRILRVKVGAPARPAAS